MNTIIVHISTIHPHRVQLRLLIFSVRFFLPPSAAAGIWTHVSRVALNQNLLKEAQPAELLCRSCFSGVLKRKNVGPNFCFSVRLFQTFFPICSILTIAQIGTNDIHVKLSWSLMSSSSSSSSSSRRRCQLVAKKYRECVQSFHFRIFEVIFCLIMQKCFRLKAFTVQSQAWIILNVTIKSIPLDRWATTSYWCLFPTMSSRMGTEIEKEHLFTLYNSEAE